MSRDASDATSRPRVSTRDPEELGRGLVAWLSRRGDGARPRVVDVSTPEHTGMSSDTVLFDVVWDDGARPERLVARLAPGADAAPLFPEYDLERQYRTMQAVAANTAVPVPGLRGFERDPAYVGSEFIVMERVEGVAPPDIPPYVFGAGWVAEAGDDDRARMERASVGVLAALHAIPDAPSTFPWLARPGGASPLRAHVDEQRAYCEWALAGRRGRLLERGFAWLEEHWPETEDPPVLSWGDARIGNILYRGFQPVAVLDWEMAALGPRELDVAWMIYLHRFFDDLALEYGFPGLPGFLARDQVTAAYTALTGHAPRCLDWYTTYAAVRHAIIMTRVGLRQVHFGEAEMPDDLDDLVTHRASLEAMLSGTYWDLVPT